MTHERRTPPTRRCKRNHGFTLVEVLIAVAIIALLAAVLVANLSGARQSSYDTVAKTCANEISTAELLYKTDNGVFTDDFGSLDQDAVPTCNKPGVTVNFSSADATSFAATVKHDRGRTTFTVTQSGVQ